MEFLRNKLLILSVRLWTFGFILLSLMLLGLILGSLLSKEWVVSNGWTGGILRINTGVNSGTHYSSINCNNCLYSRLNTGGIVCIVFDLISLILTLCWTTGLVYQTKGINFIRGWRKYLIILGAVISHWTGIITWGAVTGLGFQGTERSSTGPALSVSVAVLYPVISLIYLIIFVDPTHQQHSPNMESIRIEGRHKWTDSKSCEEIDNRN
jgi:hypothetical protein